MPNLTSAVLCICPFYVGETEKSITCEGMIDGTHARSVFESREEKRQHMERCCYTHKYGRRCWHAAALLSKDEER